MVAQASSSGGFIGNTVDNPKNETLKAIEWRNRVVSCELINSKEKKELSKVQNKKGRVVVEKEVKKNFEGEKSEHTSEDEDKGYTLNRFIGKNSPFKRAKKHTLNEPNPELPDYIKPSYPILKKTPKKEKEMSKYKKFVEILNNIKVNISLCEALEKMCVYSKFMKELLLGKQMLKHDENITLAEECSAIIQRKLPQRLSNPCRFTTPYSIGSLNINHALCDL